MKRTARRNKVANLAIAYYLNLSRSQKRALVKAKTRELEVYVTCISGHMCARTKTAQTSVRNDCAFEYRIRTSSC
jgi:hypothetical protein